MFLATYLFNHCYHLSDDQTVQIMSCLSCCKSAVRAETHYSGALYTSTVPRSSFHYTPWLHSLHAHERTTQQHRGIKSNTHIECGLIIHDGELHNVGIHWLLRVAEEGRKKIGFKFSLQEKKTTLLSLQVHPTTWEESLSCTTKQNIHKETRVTAYAKAAMPGTPSLY